jgi:RES domain-containing protein
LIVAWRLVRKKYEAAAMSGEGARQYPGRWNSLDIPMVYTCGTASLAVLEVRVHAGPEGEGIPYVLCRIEIPKRLIEIVDPNNLPPDWRQTPPSSTTQMIGAEWARSQRSAVLRVPSVIVPEDFNYLINPLHAACKKLGAITKQDYVLDSRLW